jgi:hypothetical protein
MSLGSDTKIQSEFKTYICANRYYLDNELDGKLAIYHWLMSKAIIFWAFQKLTNKCYQHYPGLSNDLSFNKLSYG